MNETYLHKSDRKKGNYQKKKTECWWKFCGMNKDVAKRQKMRIINKMQHPRPINGKEMKNIHFTSIFSMGIHFSRSGARFSFHRLNVYSTKISSSVCLSLTPSTADTRIHLAVTGKVNETVILSDTTWVQLSSLHCVQQWAVVNNSNTGAFRV